MKSCPRPSPVEPRNAPSRRTCDALLCVALATISTPCFPLDPSQIFEKVAPAIVVVLAHSDHGAPMRFGSGVVIAPGQVVTNCHVIRGSQAIYLKRDRVKSAAKLKYADPDRDLCQLSATDPMEFSRAVTSISNLDNLRVGHKVYAIGAPEGLELTFSDGIVTSLRLDPIIGTMIQTNAAISKGSSGGGLFSADGQLIGITTSQFVAGQNLNFAVPASLLSELAARHKEREAQSAETREARERAIQEILVWARGVAAKDSHYELKQAKLIPRIPSMMKAHPPSQWLTAVQNAYDEIKVTTDDEKRQAIQKITAWARTMATEDPAYSAKQAKLLPEVSVIMKNHPPSRWLSAFQDAYYALDEEPSAKPPQSGDSYDSDVPVARPQAAAPQRFHAPPTGRR